MDHKCFLAAHVRASSSALAWTRPTNPATDLQALGHSLAGEQIGERLEPSLDIGLGVHHDQIDIAGGDIQSCRQGGPVGKVLRFSGRVGMQGSWIGRNSPRGWDASEGNRD